MPPDKKPDVLDAVRSNCPLSELESHAALCEPAGIDTPTDPFRIGVGPDWLAHATVNVAQALLGGNGGSGVRVGVAVECKDYPS